MDFTPQREQVFEYANPTFPDFALFQIEKCEFGKNDENQTVFKGFSKIIESQHPDNVEMGMPHYHRLCLINDKPFSIQQFLGFMEAVTGKTIQINSADYFNDVRIQAEIQKNLPTMVFGATIVENTYVDKKTQKPVTKAQFGRFYTKAEYLKEKGSGNSTAASASAPQQSAPNADQGAASGGSFFG